LNEAGELLMNKHLLAVLVGVLILSSFALAKGEIIGNVSVGESLLVTFEFKGLDQEVYVQALTQFTAQRIPETIANNLEKKNQTVLWGTATLEHDNASRMIRSSFYLGGSGIVGFTVNKTTLKRVFELKTDWRRFQVNVTDSFSVDFASALATPVAEWQKTDDTTFYYENRNTGTLDVLFYLVLPASASGVRVQGDSVFYEGAPALEDQFLGTPFLILVALAVALVIVLLYRKVR